MKRFDGARVMMALVFFSASVAGAQSPSSDGSRASAAEEQGWSFRLIPYLWTANLDGSIAQGNLPEVDVNASFGDLFENLDFAAAAFFSARNGPWVLLTDVDYVGLGIEKTVGASTVEVDSNVLLAALAGGYCLARGEPRELDLFAGLRYVRMNNAAKSTGGVVGSFTKNEDWIDPLVGFNARARLSGRFRLGLLADLGGFGVGSDLTYELMPSLSYRASDALSIEFGYRWLDIDFEDSDFTYDVVQSGWMLGLGIGF